jgi:hypothetical protein
MLTQTKNGAIDFLLSRRDQHGWWRDFHTHAGSSDEWVTAYVGTALAEVADDRAVRAAREAWILLQQCRGGAAGWSYNQHVPADADSTLWALHLASRVGAGRWPRVRRAARFLSSHMRPDGGLATYAEEGPIRRFTRLPHNISFEGWCGSHACVTAVAAGLPGFAGRASALDYVRRAQSADGCWIGYWWCDREYTTSLAVDALARSADAKDVACVEQAVAWAAGRVGCSGVVETSQGESAFAAAHCLRILTRARDKRRVRAPLEAAVARLVATQRADGGWLPSARLRIPPPSVTNPEKHVAWAFNSRRENSIQVDVNGCFTTATVLRALHEVEQELD